MRSKTRIRFVCTLSVALVGFLTLGRTANCIDFNQRTHLVSYAASSPTTTNQYNFGAPLTVFRAVANPLVVPQVSSLPLPFSPPMVAVVPFLINSLNRRDQAWAAYLIGQHGLTQYIPQLLQLLVPTSPLQPITSELTEARALDRVILDAFIQLKAKVPGERLMPVYGYFQDEVVIVLSMSPGDSQKTLLSLHDSPQPDTRWFTICNLLASSRAEGFAARLLRDITIKISLLVSESGQGGVGGASWGGPGGIGCGPFGMPKDFPPTSIYELTEEPEEGNVLVAEGVRPVYYRRQLVPMNQQIGVGHGSTFNDRDIYRRDYLALLLGQDSQSLGLNPRPSYPIRWTSAEAFAAQAKHIDVLHRRSFWRLAGQLHDEGLLTSEEREGLKPKISFVLHDLREDKAIPVPVLGLTVSP